MPRPRTLALALLAAHALTLIVLCFVAKLTVDENSYLRAGRYLAQHLAWDPINTVLHGPVAFFPNQLFALIADSSDIAAYLPWGRLGMVPFSVLAGLGVFVLGRRAFGPAAGSAALLVWSTNPIVLANGCLVTADMALACGAVWTLERAWAWLQAPAWPRALGLGAALGATLATKYLALFLVPALGVVLLGKVLVGGRHGLSRRMATGCVAFATVTVVALVTLHTCYLWRPGGYAITQTASHLPAEDPAAGPQSAALRAVLRTAPGRALLPTLPAPFVRGADYQQLVADHQVSSFGDRISKGFVGYYGLALALKLPLAFLALLVAGCLARTPRGAPGTRLVLGAGVAVPLVLLSGFTTLQIGVRYALSVVPLLCVVAGRGLAGLIDTTHTKVRRGVGLGLGAALLVGVAWDWPAYLTSFNLLVSRPYLWFRDSTLDWRVPTEPAPERDALLARHPGAILATARTGPLLGQIVVHGDQLGPQDPRDATRVHHWLRRFAPADRMGAWFAFAIDSAGFDALTRDEASPRGRSEFAAALLGANDIDGARRVVAGLDDPLAERVRAGLDVLAGTDAAARARLWGELGRPDLVVAMGGTAPLAVRAQALFQAGDAAGVIEVLGRPAAEGRLAPAEVYLLATALRDVGRGQDGLDLLLRLTPAPADRALHDRLVERLRQELDAAARLDRRP